MFNKSMIFMLCIISTSLAQAPTQSINLTGTVLDSKGNPMKGVSVKLMSAGIYDTTNASGEYSFFISSVKNYHSQFALPNVQLSVECGKINFSMKISQTVSISIFDMKGRYIQRILPEQVLKASNYNYEINNKKISNGLYLIRLQFGSKIISFIYCNSGSTTAYAGTNKTTESPLLTLAKTKAITDYLLFETSGYLKCKLPISSYSGTNKVYLQQKNGIQSACLAKYYSENDGTKAGVGNDGTDPDIVARLIDSETVDRPAINYSYSDFHNINSYNFFGVWKGEINSTGQDQKICANFDVSWSNVSFSIDDSVIASWSNSNKVIPLHLTSGKHTFSVDLHNHWHTTGFNVSFTGYPVIQMANANSEMGIFIKDSSKSIYIGTYESGSRYNEVTLTVPETQDSIALFLTSYSAITWLIDNPHNTKIVCIGFSAYAPGSTVVGAGETPIYEISDFQRSYDEFSGPSNDISKITGKAPVWTFGGYSPSKVDILLQ